ncbi:polygalacturonase-like precursor [Cucumis melo var. makuwa]|nr:polygalacturonase-like precursor [Cucumis melo var. makuwa]TYK02282.1 polygalacturonase-like precursor [Cucumis melo var. makuwa]
MFFNLTAFADPITFDILNFGDKLESFAAPITFNVVDFGAKPNNIKIDSSKAFESAWKQACSSSRAATIYVPKAKFYIYSATFKGPCKNNVITLQMDGTLVAPPNFHLTAQSKTWIIFRQVNGVTVLGGVIDGQGSELWACKHSGKTCPRGTTSLQFTNSQNIVISGLTSLNSQIYHIVINKCRNVRMERLNIYAPANSPNTDGIDLEETSYVTILDSNIGTGDDCISVGPGTSNVLIQNIYCGPGHGISIGSLGRKERENGVQNVTVQSCRLKKTQNGVRIKSWGRPSTGFATNIRFQHITMTDVKNPIVINQNYCPHNQGCPGKESGIKISDVTYKSIYGTSASLVAIKLDCSPKFPCKGIVLENVQLTYKNGNAKASCINAQGSTVDMVEPMGCFEEFLSSI